MSDQILAIRVDDIIASLRPETRGLLGVLRNGGDLRTLFPYDPVVDDAILNHLVKALDTVFNGMLKDPHRGRFNIFGAVGMDMLIVMINERAKHLGVSTRIIVSEEVPHGPRE